MLNGDTRSCQGSCGYHKKAEGSGRAGVPSLDGDGGASSNGYDEYSKDPSRRKMHLRTRTAVGRPRDA